MSIHEHCCAFVCVSNTGLRQRNKIIIYNNRSITDNNLHGHTCCDVDKSVESPVFLTKAHRDQLFTTSVQLLYNRSSEPIVTIVNRHYEELAPETEQRTLCCCGHGNLIHTHSSRLV